MQIVFSEEYCLILWFSIQDAISTAKVYNFLLFQETQFCHDLASVLMSELPTRTPLLPTPLDPLTQFCVQLTITIP